MQQRAGRAARRQGPGRVQTGHRGRELHVALASGAEKGGERSQDDNHASVSRRSMMALLLATGCVQPARADDSADLDDEDAEAIMNAVMKRQPSISGSHRERTVLMDRELSFEARIHGGRQPLDAPLASS